MKIIRIVMFTSLAATTIIYLLSRTWELDLIAALQESLPAGAVPIFQIISDSISYFSVGIPVLLIIYSLIRADQRLRVNALKVLLSIAVAGLLNYGVKKVVREPRPYEVDSRIQQWSGGGGFGFPSGHTAEAVAAAAAASLAWTESVVMVSTFLWALTIMFSRIYLGVHDPGDIMAGAFLGSLSALFIDRVADSINRMRRTS